MCICVCMILQSSISFKHQQNCLLARTVLFNYLFQCLMRLYHNGKCINYKSVLTLIAAADAFFSHFIFFIVVQTSVTCILLKDDMKHQHHQNGFDHFECPQQHFLIPTKIHIWKHFDWFRIEYLHRSVSN